MSAGPPLVVIRGGGDLATGAAARLHRAGFAVIITELLRPLVLRRTVALAEAVFSGETQVEDLLGRRAGSPALAKNLALQGLLPVLIDPECDCLPDLRPVALVDARMRKQPNELGLAAAPLVVGLGPGFVAGVDCHAVVETRRGHRLGRVLWQGPAEADTRIPEAVGGQAARRVLRAPVDGAVEGLVEIGDPVKEGQVVIVMGGTDARAEVRAEVRAPFDGVLRGLVHPGVEVPAGTKIGDVDPRGVPAYCWEISDKSLAVGGGVLEALLMQRGLRLRLGERTGAAG
ncbi:MAG: EF2563 family selenium-dependent molybdenum hydroxylase system protein [Chloroflexi bacterium]|nr:EF2563 family selenium-dependent molybdenum hydroxylase system protein [Chloroflexota bacterium]